MTDLYVRPGNILPLFSRLYPNAWKQVDEFRARRKELGDWPDWCFLPLAGTYAIVSKGKTLQTPNQAHHVGILGSGSLAGDTGNLPVRSHDLRRPLVDPCHQGHSYVPTDSASLRFVSVMMSSHRGAPDSPLTPGDVESSVSYGRRPLRESLDIRALPPGRRPRPSGERQTGVTGRFPERRAEPTFLADEMSAPADFQVNDAVSE